MSDPTVTHDHGEQPVPHRKRSFVSRYLDPVESVGEVLTGLVMVLTFTLGAGLIVEEGPDATKKMLAAILGCNVTWGVIDGVMHVMSRMFDLSSKSRLLESIRNGSGDEPEAIVARALDGEIAPLTSPVEREHLYRGIASRLQHVGPERIHLKKQDFYGAVVTFLLVVGTSIPGVLPFLVFHDRTVALRVSNFLLLSLLFLVGYRWARATHSSHPWLFGSLVLLLGLGMVAIAMWLAP